MTDYLARNYRAASPERTTWGGQNGFVTVYLEGDIPFMSTSDVTYLAIHNAITAGEHITDEQAVYKTNAEYNYSRVMELLAQKAVIVTTAFVAGNQATPAAGVADFGFSGKSIAEAEDGTLSGADAIAIAVLVERADVFTKNQLPTYTHQSLVGLETNPLQEVVSQFVSTDFPAFLSGVAVSSADGSTGEGQFDVTTGELISVDYTVDVSLVADGARAFVTNVVMPFV